MKKVVHLITLLELGGAQGNTIHTVKNLDPNIYEAHLWCGKGAYWDDEMENILGPQNRIQFFSSLVRPINPILDLLAVWDLFWAFRKMKPEILHTHSSKAGIIGRLAGFLAGIPIIIHTFHGFGFNNQQKPWTRYLFVTLEKFLAKCASILIFVSQANWDEALALHIGEESQYRLIRSGVPLQSLKLKRQSIDVNEIRSKLGIPNQNKLITTISAFKPQKNLTDFLKMAIKVKKMCPPTSFVLVGDGEQRAELERIISQENLTHSVLMPGWQKDSSEILGASDIFVLTSLWEGLPRALVEAQAMGIPSVCYKTDGVSDVLILGGGAMFPQGQWEQLSEEVIRLLSDSKHWEATSAKAKMAISEDYDIDGMVKSQEKLYASLIHF